MPHIPPDIIRDILSRLPVKSLLRFKCVCKLWNFIISDRNFTLSNEPQRKKAIVCSSKLDSISSFHSVNCEFAAEELPFPKENSSSVCRFLGACHSLLLLSFDTDIYMWNPSTRHCKKVLEMEQLAIEWDKIIPGFCYDESSNDYIAVIGLFHYSKPCAVLVASMKDKNWKTITFPYDLGSARGGPFVNGRLHWIVNEPKGINYEGFDPDYAAYLRLFLCPDQIIYFNSQTSEFDLLSTPDDISEEQNILCLGVLGDCLCMVCWFIEEIHYDYMKVMIMKDYGIKESWTTLFTIPRRMYNLNMLHLIENKEEAFMVADHEISVYDRVEEKHRSILPITGNRRFQAAAISESLVSPSDYRWDDRTYNVEINEM
ncbi:hypothetical protein ACJIZ3_017071 [Penstemon smallii]|uniref:F-box domain-containing protein n=1 Tax=Penstemon smallii TaxID=265156 RepID=A0ABD3SUI8_9LAMI